VLLRILKNLELWRYVAMAVVLVGAGAGVAYLLMPPPPLEAKPEAPVELRVGGQALSTKGDAIGNAMDLVRRYASSDLVIRLPDGSSRKLKKGALGAEIDRVRLAEFVKEATRPNSPLRRAHEAKRPGKPLDVPLPIKIDAAEVISKLLDIKAEVDSAASDAVIDLNEKHLRPEKPGQRIDVYATLANIDSALRAGKDDVPAAAEVIVPKLSTKDLGDVKFDQVLGYFETRYSQGGKARERTYNLRLAASKLDGAVVMPGAVFDFNGTVGPRDEAHGYRVAPVIAQGELVDGLGGGTCQISGTLHGAAFFAGLEMVERYPHSRPSFYIKMGLDATVVYPTINFRFRNPFDFPVVLHETVANGVVRAEILGPSRKLTVSYFRRIDEVVPFEEVERKTPKLPEGARILAQRGIPGFKTSSSRVVRDGAYAVRERWSDTYPPTTQIIHVGSGPKDMESKQVDDAHPEYVVDEYLVVTQGPDIRTPGTSGGEVGGGTVETREAGKTGERGWIEKGGFSTFKAKSDVAPDETEAEGGHTKQVAAKDVKDEGGDGDKPKKKKKRKKKKKDDE
jgi:vancomycin resistance protein YoaR